MEISRQDTADITAEQLQWELHFSIITLKKMQLKQNKSLEHTGQYGKCGLILLQPSQFGRTLHSPSKQENRFHIAFAARFTI